MNPADLSLPGISPTLTTKNLSLNTSLLGKSGKVPVPRIDVEPIYVQLKSALGDHWNDYKAALGAFVLGMVILRWIGHRADCSIGNLNQTELIWVLGPVLTTIPTPMNGTSPPTSILQLHNQLVSCIYTNIIRDAPSSDVAPWVVATDKPSAAKASNAIGASDKAEERLKREIMALAPKDRRRVKQVKPEAPPRPAGGLKEMQDYRFELSSRPPDASKSSTGWDMETRRKYIQPLAAETLEFPSLSDMQNRIEPICHDEGLIGSTQASTQACAELLEQAAEAYIKTVLGELQARSRSNRTGCVQTAKFKHQLQREELELERGSIQRSATGLLPVESEVQLKRDPLSSSDLRLAIEMRDPFMIRDRFLAEKTMLDRYPSYSADVVYMNGDDDSAMDLDAPADDDDLLAWQGATKAATDSLMGVLSECLAV